MHDDGRRKACRSPTIGAMAKLKAVARGWTLGSEGQMKKQHSAGKLLGCFEDRGCKKGKRIALAQNRAQGEL